MLIMFHLVATQCPVYTFVIGRYWRLVDESFYSRYNRSEEEKNSACTHLFHSFVLKGCEPRQ
jgi:hypothetical protein